MTNIFLSRPTYIPKKQTEGLQNFENYLKSLGFTPRTLGTTDYPNESPLDEVLRMMDECYGAIILGFSQILVEKGTLKNTRIVKPIKLATEWNQIEAALAYSKDLPLLIIHDIGVSRGIFDRGTLNGFIHEEDFSNPSWSLSKELTGAIKTWTEKVKDKIK